MMIIKMMTPERPVQMVSLVSARNSMLLLLVMLTEAGLTAELAPLAAAVVQVVSTCC